MPKLSPAKLIAPCGMNCALCIAFQRDKNRCSGCNSEGYKLNHCATCSIRNCAELKKNGAEHCYDCAEFPCARLKQLDKRYREKYGMSMIENLQDIKANGMDKFLEDQNNKWTCGKCQALLCVHRDTCQNCLKA